MKKISVLILLFCVFLVNAQVENYYTQKFVYNLTFQLDSTDINSKRTERMLLFVNKDKTLFQSENSFLRDSILASMKYVSNDQIESIDISKFPKTQFNYKIVNDSKSDSLAIYDKIFTDIFFYKEPKSLMKWAIKKDTATINGLMCQKATTNYGGRCYEAWFSYNIPLASGPYKFHDLPGLIVKIYDRKKHYVFNLIHNSVINYKYNHHKEEQNIFYVDKSTFLKKSKDFRRNLIARMAQSGFTVNDSYKQQIKINQKKRNNPIELKEEDE